MAAINADTSTCIKLFISFVLHIVSRQLLKQVRGCTVDSFLIMVMSV